MPKCLKKRDCGNGTVTNVGTKTTDRECDPPAPNPRKGQNLNYKEPPECQWADFRDHHPWYCPLPRSVLWMQVPNNFQGPFI